MRLAWRLATRSLRVAWGRSLLVVALLAVPLAAALVALTLRQSAELPIETRVEAVMGQASAVLVHPSLTVTPSAESIARAETELGAALGRSIRLEAEVGGGVPLRVSDREVDTYLYGLAESKLHDGLFTVLEGSWPSGPDSVALSESAAALTGAQVGDSVALGDEPRSRATVSGIAAIPTDRARKFMFADPDLALSLVKAGQDEPQVAAQEDRAGTVVWYPESDLTGAELRTLSGSESWQVKSRSYVRSQLEADQSSSVGGTDEVKTLIVAVFGALMIELFMLVVAIYMVMIGSLRREFALLAVVGSSPRQRTRILIIQGILTGVAASAVAIAVAWVAALAAAPYVARRSNQVWDRIHPDWQLSLLLLGVAALTPPLAAWACGRVDAKNVLACVVGVEQNRVPGRALVLSAWAASVVGGALVIFGAVARLGGFTFLGAVVMTVAAALWLRRLLGVAGGRSDGGSILRRLARRLASLYPARSATVAGVVGSLLVVFGLVLTSYGGMSVQALRSYVPATPEGSLFLYAESRVSPATVAAVEAELGDAPLVQMGLALGPRPAQPPGQEPYTGWGAIEVASPFSRCLNGQGPEPGEGRTPAGCSIETGFPELYQSPTLHTIDATGLSTAIGRPLTAREKRDFADGVVMVTDDRLLADGRVRLDSPGAGRQVAGEFPASALQARSPYTAMPNAFVAAEALSDIGGEVAPNQVAWFAPVRGEAITDELESRIRAMVSAEIGSGSYLLDVERGSPVAGIMQRMIAAGIAAMIFIAAGLALLIISLAAREMRPVMTALASAGTDKKTRAKVAGMHAVHVVGLGLAVAAVVLAVAMPAVLVTLRLPVSYWPILGLGGAGAASLLVALVAGRVMGSRIGELSRSELAA